jgi:hypothetical protein
MGKTPPWLQVAGWSLAGHTPWIKMGARSLATLLKLISVRIKDQKMGGQATHFYLQTALLFIGRLCIPDIFLDGNGAKKAQ